MTPQQQRIAIAKVFGWKNFNSASDEGAMQYGQPPNAPQFIGELPDYLGDLNACHEMEKVLTYEQAELFEDALCDIAKSANDVLKNSLQSKSFIFHATARQRAEAFLRTLGLWTPTPTQPQ
jgi:hypothetical protein